MENNLAKHNTSVYQQLPKKSPQPQLEGRELQSKAGYYQMEPNIMQQKWKWIGHTLRQSSNGYHQEVSSGSQKIGERDGKADNVLDRKQKKAQDRVVLRNNVRGLRRSRNYRQSSEK